MGFVPQSIELFAGTIRDNLIFVRQDATDEECIASLEAAQLRGLLERSREGLDTRIGEGGLKLSGGERQRLAIARALLRKPDLLIFDEATSSLDTETEKEITRTIDGIIRTRPSFVTLLIAHRLSTVASADRIVVLKKGRVVEQGSHLELLRKKTARTTRCGRQQGLERDEETPSTAPAREDEMENQRAGEDRPSSFPCSASAAFTSWRSPPPRPRACWAPTSTRAATTSRRRPATATGSPRPRSAGRFPAAGTSTCWQRSRQREHGRRFSTSLDRSLRNLKTDHVDLMFMHAVQSIADVEEILGPGGAMEGATRRGRRASSASSPSAVMAGPTPSCTPSRATASTS